MSNSNSTFKFCKKCNTETDRYKCGHCKTCSKKNASDWRVENPEKVKIASADWYAKNRDVSLANRAEWVKANPEKEKSRVTEWVKSNPEKSKAIKNRWTEKNVEKIRDAKAIWVKKNRVKTRIYSQNRRSKKKSNGGRLSKDIAGKLFKLQKGKCACCKLPLEDNYHLDHIMPLALGGSNTDDNMQLLHQRCNSKKSAKHPIDFMQERGYLI